MAPPNQALDAATVALQRWVDALNGFGRPDLVAAAVASDIYVARMGFHDTRGEVVEELRGRAEVSAWLARTAKVVRFELSAASVTCGSEPGACSCRYLVIAPEDFRGGGTWQARLDGGGRIAWLRHQPDDLPASSGEPARPHRHR